MQTFDAIVLGCGGMGSATLYHLAQRGLHVLGVEQLPLVHHRGSSHGRTRVIRTAYYEHADYVPLLHRAFEGWYDLEQTVGRHLLSICGCLSMGPSAGEMIQGVKRAAREHNLAVSELGADDLANLDLPFCLQSHHAAVYEEQAGFLAVEECVRAHLDAAQACGATILAECPVLSWTASGDAVEVVTKQGTFHAGMLAITAGAWATHLLQSANVPLTVMRQVQQWFRPVDAAQVRRDRFPVFMYESSFGHFYGIPMIDSRGVKLAQHYGAPELSSPDEIDWTPTANDTLPVRAFIDTHLPQLQECTAQVVCMYTLSPDRHFIIDHHPQHANVVFAAGFSGHGFKFCPVVGESLANMMTTSKYPFPSDLFRLSRFGKSV